MEKTNAWKTWLKEHAVVAQMDEPLVTKDARENLHDTFNATNTMKNDPITKATDYFADTIAELLPELGGEVLYQCFVLAVEQAYEQTEKEFESVKSLMEFTK